MELDLEVNRIARADDDRCCRRIDDGRRLAGLGDVDGHIDVQNRIIDKFVVLQDIEHIIEFIDALLVDVIFGIIHVVPGNILIAAIGRADRIGQSRRAAARAVDGLVDRIVYRRGCQDRRQLIVFDDLDALGHGRVRIRIPCLDDDRDARCQIAVLAADTGAAVLGDLADFGSNRTELEGTGQVIDDCEDVGVVHEIVDAALFQEGMAEGDDVVVIDVGHGPDGPHLHIAVDESRGDTAARFQRKGRTVAAGRGRIDGHEVVIRQFALHPRRRQAVEARRHEGRRNGDERRFAGIERPDFFFRRHIPELEHVIDGRNHADTGIGKGPAVSDGTEEFAIDIDRTAAHALGNAARFFDEGSGKLGQDQIP